MKYLVLDEHLNIMKSLSTSQLEETLRKNGYKSIKTFMLDTGGILNGVQIIEDSLEFDAKKFKHVCDSKQNRYFASSEGYFYKISKKSNRKTKLKLKEHKGEVRVNIAGKTYNAARLIARLFMDDYSEDKIVVIGTKGKHCLATDNLQIKTRKEFYGLVRMNPQKNSNPIGLFENGKCIQKFESIGETSRKLHYSYGTILYHLKKQMTCMDVRYL